MAFSRKPWRPSSLPPCIQLEPHVLAVLAALALNLHFSGADLDKAAFGDMIYIYTYPFNSFDNPFTSIRLMTFSSCVLNRSVPEANFAPARHSLASCQGRERSSLASTLQARYVFSEWLTQASAASAVLAGLARHRRSRSKRQAVVELAPGC